MLGLLVAIQMLHHEHWVPHIVVCRVVAKRLFYLVELCLEFIARMLGRVGRHLQCERDQPLFFAILGRHVVLLIKLIFNSR